MKNKLFTKEEKQAIEKVLDMGFSICNSAEYVLISEHGDYKIQNRMDYYKETEYKNISSALTTFCKQEIKYLNGEI